ncbi:Eco57I restriction-modification methylase domain-containing protein [Pullulanibacillus sp. KACC 23026]|uniref:Eco57I restriction-modification methylase domain-containing protein n=1 Tax=Pullulanibacillus sp. KACC 23026 TaxID=3028315 RepID=UPI0023AEDD81|nr:Eco57I restriction-modification methylase domain-containing protein [Pullulanibacillus sp. KACC 23026]WEG12600.1 Eco57I restriction-modification methylase domain-containing protein [Pullulanibacillus sp. KACC 23026]
MDQKKTGSFYTPKPLVKYMCDYAIKKNVVNEILEPSVGDGRFLEELVKYKELSIDAVEIDQQKINILKDKKLGSSELICDNFMKYAMECDKQYDLIIGNPPYIAKKNLSVEEREINLKTIRHWSLSEELFQNTWVSFVLGALKLLDKSKGAIFFVLPFEFLQVHYAEKLRTFLEEMFNFIHITTFQESVFPEIQQDVCLVYMSNEQKDKEPIVRYTTVKSIDDFHPIEESEIKRNKPLKKWSNAILNDNEIELLVKLSNKYIKVAEFGHISPGIVTGANNFFIINKLLTEKLKSKENTIPIIQKSTTINSILILTKRDFESAVDNNKNTSMLNLNSIDYSNFSKELKAYLLTGIDQGFNLRYKCAKRKRWYDVPIIKYGDLMFFKRYNQLPRIIVNKAGVYTTDIAYNIRLNKNFDASSIAFCFYNSLTITLCEYQGRFYGGGVCELVPSEFKSLSMPYKKIDEYDVEKLDLMFRNNEKLEKIVDYVDGIVLKELDEKDIFQLKMIRNKYLSRRLKIH